MTNSPSPAFVEQPSQAPSTQTLLPQLGLLLLLAVTFWCFRPALDGPFIFDDFPNLENLRHLNNGVNATSIAQYLASPKSTPGRPLAMLSFMIEDAAWPAAPGDYKRNNLLWHMLVGLFVFWLCLRLVHLRPMPPVARQWLPLICTAAWLIHPIQISATMLVVQRMTILSALFVLAGLLGYVTSLAGTRGHPLGRVVLAGGWLSVFGFMALLCKENGVLIFAYACALNLSLLRPLIAQYPIWPRRLLLAGTSAPMVALALAAVFRWDRIIEDYRIRDFSLGERLLSQPRALFDYLFNVFLPRIGGQGILHDDFVVSRGLLDPPATVFALAALAITLAFSLIYRKRAPLAAFATLWFLAGHLMESSVVALEMYFEHRNYLPMVGPLFAAAAWALRPAWPGRRLSYVFLGGWLLACGLLTRINAVTWGDRALQSQVWLHEHPHSSRAAQWAASYWLDSGEPARARQVLTEAIARLPSSSDLRLQVILLDCVSRGLAPKQWQENLEIMRGARYSHLSAMIVGNYVTQWTSGQRCQGTLSREQVFALGDALAANAAYQAVPSSIGHVHYELAKLHADARELGPLIQRLDLAWEFNPYPNIPREQAIYLLSAGHPEAAIKYLEKSNATPLPWLKAWLLDVPQLNQGLLESAKAMMASANTTAADATPSAHNPDK